MISTLPEPPWPRVGGDALPHALRLDEANRQQTDDPLDQRRRLAPEVGHRARLRLAIGERRRRPDGAAADRWSAPVASACSSEPLSRAWIALSASSANDEPDAHERVIPRKPLRVPNEIELAPRREDLGLVQLPHAAAAQHRTQRRRGCRSPLCERLRWPPPSSRDPYEFGRSRRPETGWGSWTPPRAEASTCRRDSRATAPRSPWCPLHD